LSRQAPTHDKDTIAPVLSALDSTPASPCLLLLRLSSLQSHRYVGRVGTFLPLARRACFLSGLKGSDARPIGYRRDYLRHPTSSLQPHSLPHNLHHHRATHSHSHPHTTLHPQPLSIWLSSASTRNSLTSAGTSPLLSRRQGSSACSHDGQRMRGATPWMQRRCLALPRSP